MNIDELAAAAAGMEIEDTPARRTVAQFLIAAVVGAIVLMLLVFVWSQGIRSQALDYLGRTPCYGPQCVEIPLTLLESATDVVFPEGSIVESSSRSRSMLNDWSVGFEVRIPAGQPVPDAPQPWVSEPDPETGLPTFVKILMAQGQLSDIRWTDGLWVTGVEENGDSIVLGSYRLGSG